MRSKEHDSIDSDVIDSGLAKIRGLSDDVADQLMSYIMAAQQNMDDKGNQFWARDQAREILLNDAKFIEAELDMYAIFD